MHNLRVFGGLLGLRSKPGVMGTVRGRGINTFLVRLAILLMAVALLAFVLFFKASSTGGFNPISALPVISPSVLPADLRSRLDCPASRSRVRSFDLNRDGEVEYFLECLGERDRPPTITVVAHRNGAWEPLAAGEILGILQTQTNG